MANIIYAKINTGSAPFNVLDPNSWVGDVVPGPNDVARFAGSEISYAYEWSYVDLSNTYGNRDANLAYYNRISPTQFSNGPNKFYSSSVYNIEAKEVNTLFSHRNYHANSLNGQVERDVNSYRAYYHNAIQHRGYYGLAYYRKYARTFRLDGSQYGGSQTFSYTVEGVTLSETDVTTYNTRSIYAGQDTSLPNMTQRLVDLFTGSSLHHSQGGLYRIKGPHNGLGVTNSDAEAQNFRYFTLIKDFTGSNGYTNIYTPAWGSDTNMTQYDTSNHYRVIEQFFTSSDAELLQNVGTSSLMQAANRGPTITGSGYFYTKAGDNNSYISPYGISVANPYTLKVNFNTVQNTSYFHSMSIDESYSIFTTASFVDHDLEHVNLLEPSESGYVPKQVNGTISLSANRITSDFLIQRYELTGSQHWNVGRVEMNDANIFHIKDDATITLYDLQDGTYYPAIDMTDRCSGDSDLIITDRATIQVSSSRTTVPAESGIWQYRVGTSVLISGSQNYSSSIAPSASTAGDVSIPISELQDCFGVGDYISIESTGSLRLYNRANGRNYGYPYTSSTFGGGDYQEIVNRYSGIIYNNSTNQRNYTSSIDMMDGSYTGYTADEITHTVENDEIFQIVSMSMDNAFVAKKYGKTGYIHQDLGLFTHDEFVEEFGESVGNTYAGSKRVVLVDSTHKRFQRGDKLIINSSSISTVLHTLSYNSQSRFYDFTQGTTRADEVFDMQEGPFSGSSIWTYAYGSYGITTNAYYSEQNLKHRLVITGSEFQNGSTKWGTGLLSNAYNSSRYGGASGSANGYIALRLDPTMCYTWRNDTHRIQSTNYLSAHLPIKDLLWDEGDITVSGSLIRDGIGDPTSSIAYDPDNYVKIFVGKPPAVGPTAMNSNTETNPQTQYIYPYPYGMMIAYGGFYGYSRAGTANECNLGLDPNNPYATAGLGNTPQYPQRYAPVSKSFATDTGFTDEYVDWTRLAENTGSFHIKLSVKDKIAETFLRIKDKEISVEKFPLSIAPSRMGVGIKKYASIHSINITQRYQLLLLDTTDSYDKENFIQQLGLLENHYPNKNVKFIATEVVDVKGHKNLLWDYDYNKRVGDIRPYTNAVCRTGTTAGTSQYYLSDNYYGNAPFTPRTGRVYQAYTQGQSNANYYTITDLGTPVEFDTIGMQFVHTSYMDEYYISTANQMNDVRFEVCNDIGVESPNWVTVRATEDDKRYFNGVGGIRFYTFASGSVTARFIKYHSRGGTRSSTLYYYSHMGVYNFSASCAPGTAPNSGSIRHEKGGPTGSICQMEFANTKNWAVGDKVIFHQKHGTGAMRNYQSYVNSDYYGTQLNSTWYNLHNDDTVNGIHPYHTITAIHGNVVTLDRPFTRFHAWDRIMAIKYNRGKITFESTTAASGSGYGSGRFRLEFYNARNFHRVSHVTGHNAVMYGYNGAPGGGIRYLSDVGMIPNDTTPTFYANGKVLLRNVYVSRWAFAQNTNPQKDQMLSFNVYDLAGNSTEAISQTGNTKYVYNFNTRLGYGYEGVVTAHTYTKDHLPDIYWKNNSHAWQYSSGVTNHYLYDLYGNYNPTIHLGDQIIAAEMSCRNGTSISQVYGGQEMLLEKGAYVRKHNIIDKNAHPIRTLGRQGAMNLTHAYQSNNAFMDHAYSVQMPISLYGKYQYKEAQDTFGNRDYVTLGTRYIPFFFVENDNPGEYEVYNAGNNVGYITENYQHIFLNCIFDVKEETDVRIDFDMTYKVPIMNKYGVGQSMTNDYSVLGQNMPKLTLNNNHGQFLDVQHLFSTTFEDVSTRKVFTLTPGRYFYRMRMNRMYTMSNNLWMTVKNMDLKLVTPDLSKIEIIDNNFDVLKLFQNKNFKRNTKNYQTPDAGANAVLKQSSDLGGTTNYKFNKIKL